MHKLFLKSFPYTLLLLLGACGAPNQDGGNSNNLSGLAVDGYLAGARVFMDINGNAKLDAYEPWAFTDQEGRFGIASDGTNYCAATTTLKYCLSTGDYSGYELRIEGGYDSVTGEAFEGVLSRTLDGTSNQITSPASSAFGIMSAAQQTAWLLAENSAATTTLTSGLLLADPLAGITATDANQTHLIQTSWLLHKSVAIMAAELLRIYPHDPNNLALATDYAPYVYQALVTTWSADTTQDMLTLLGTVGTVDAIMTEANTLLLADGAIANGGYTPAVDIETRIGKLITLIDTNLFTTTGYSQAAIYARARAIEVLTIMLSAPTINAGFVDAATTDMTTNIANFQSIATNVSAIAADYAATGAAVTDYSARNTLANLLPADPTIPIVVTDGGGSSADVLIDPGTGVVSIDMVADIDGDGVDDNVQIPGTIVAINDYTSIMTLDIAGTQQTIIVETGPAGELIFDTSALEGLGLADLSGN